jgi:two-component system, NtrC family, response regulator HydG
VTRSVLVIDDDRQMAQTLCAVLRLHGWEPTAGYSGEDAIAAVRTKPFAAVLMDVRMPGVDGVEAFRRIRAEFPRLPVILMTAYAAQELLAQAEREGVLTILPKPLPIDRLTETLADLSRTGPVLVLDDEPDFLETLGAILAAKNHGVLKASSLEQALNVLNGASPTVVVMDLNLGPLRPRDAILAIKRVSPEVLLILYSGQFDVLDETVSELPADWVCGALRKPFPPERLLELLNGVHRN